MPDIKLGQSLCSPYSQSTLWHEMRVSGLVYYSMRGFCYGLSVVFTPCQVHLHCTVTAGEMCWKSMNLSISL